MILTHTKNQGLDIVTIAGRFVMADAPESRESFKTIVEAGASKLLVDLSGVSFIDTSGLSVLISAYKMIRAKDGRMVLCGIPVAVRTLLELTRLNEIFESFASVEAALAVLGKD
jgi:anti-sigma B factor antagonist